MEPITTIAGVATAAKATAEAVRAILERGKGREAEKAAKEALALIAELNSRLLLLQEMALRLGQEKAQAIEENAKLRAEIREKEERATERKKYQGVKVGSSLLLVREDHPDIFYCPTCDTTKGQAITLQPITSTLVHGVLGWKCNVCGGEFR